MARPLFGGKKVEPPPLASQSIITKWILEKWNIEKRFPAFLPYQSYSTMKLSVLANSFMLKGILYFENSFSKWVIIVSLLLIYILSRAFTKLLEFRDFH